MPICRNIRLALGLLAIAAGSFACQNSPFQKQPDKPLTVRDVPAVRLNFRYEADVPPPTEIPGQRKAEERNAAVQADFDNNRPQELLDLTVSSPDKKHVLAVYHRITDINSEYRLDMYAPDGKAERKLTSDTMAVHFPETIVWSPDSGNVAFVAMIRAGQGIAVESPTPGAGAKAPATPPANSNSASPEETPDETETPAAPAAPTPAPPTGILTFRTEQIYIAAADGSGVKPITENEGLIYFYYAWSPDSTMLAALAATSREWRYLELMSESKKELMVPQGRPRIIEKNGRERRLDDNLTGVHPVWSPDSTKVAAAFDTQIRIYDAAGTNPTQAAIPLRNQLLLSSQVYDVQIQRQALEANTNSEANPAATPDQPVSMLPDEKSLVSYNPIVEIAWAQEDLLYLETAYLKRMKNEADNVTSFARWHRLALTPQVTAPANIAR
jgi:hypothetical protein